MKNEGAVAEPSKEVVDVNRVVNVVPSLLPVIFQAVIFLPTVGGLAFNATLQILIGSGHMTCNEPVAVAAVTQLPLSPSALMLLNAPYGLKEVLTAELALVTSPSLPASASKIGTYPEYDFFS